MTREQRKLEKRLRWEAKQEELRFQKYGPRKQGAFVNITVKKQLMAQVELEKRTILKPRMWHLRLASETLSVENFALEVEQYLILSNSISCKMKPSFTMEEAGSAEQLEREELTPYICRSCGFVHFGHDPIVISIQKHKLQTPQLEQVMA